MDQISGLESDSESELEVYNAASFPFELELVRVNTILGSVAPSLSVKLKQAFISGSKDASIIESQFDQANDVHFMDAWPKSVNVGNFVFVFEAFLKLKHETKVEHIFVLGNSSE
ncbi:Dolichyl-diphosphooligosaccharide--protein glycosyltransferase subunit 2 [Camellia lanceoleosa]|uniref:Dolichyl-diphosphooligosaccharide--protein glycosyltransferase subunit 2 n=1 Tax=Camellia lanceoleosa TaxID=1840588 RepID=A0ACC0HV68_9ERIC|nr:Dolichyl-diphosphooligosaccharide--protein glycosyltransferase subunit 2 [Camellia lanceoleosa]